MMYIHYFEISCISVSQGTATFFSLKQHPLHFYSKMTSEESLQSPRPSIIHITAQSHNDWRSSPAAALSWAWRLRHIGRSLHRRQHSAELLLGCTVPLAPPRAGPPWGARPARLAAVAGRTPAGPRPAAAAAGRPGEADMGAAPKAVVVGYFPHYS